MCSVSFRYIIGWFPFHFINQQCNWEALAICESRNPLNPFPFVDLWSRSWWWYRFWSVVHFLVIYKVSVVIVSICFCKSSKKMHSMAKKGWERKGVGYEKQSQWNSSRRLIDLQAMISYPFFKKKKNDSWLVLMGSEQK